MDLDSVRLVLAATFLCIGTVGNILPIITVTNKHCKKSSYTVYLAGLAITDLLTLYFAILAIPLPETFGSNLTVRSALFCKLHLYFLYLFSGVSIWLIVILALESTFAVYFPFKAKSVCKPNTALITIALLVAVFSVLNSHYLYGMQIQSAGSPNDDSFKPPLDWNAFTKFDRHENVSLPPLDNSSNEDGNDDDDDSFNIDDIFSREEKNMTNAGVVMGQERDTTDHPLTTVCNSTETKSDNCTASIRTDGDIPVDRLDSHALNHAKSTSILRDRNGDTPVDNCDLSHTKSTPIPLDQDGNAPVDRRGFSHTKSSPIPRDKDRNTPVDSRGFSHTKSTPIPCEKDRNTPVDSRDLSHTKSTPIPLDQDRNTPVDSRDLSHTKSTPIPLDQDGNTPVDSRAFSHTKSTPKPRDKDRNNPVDSRGLSQNKSTSMPLDQDGNNSFDSHGLSHNKSTPELLDQDGNTQVDSRGLSYTKSTSIPFDQNENTPVDSRALSYTKSTPIPLDQDGNTPIDSRGLSHTKSTSILFDQNKNTQVESCALSYTKSTLIPLDQDGDTPVDSRALSHTKSTLIPLDQDGDMPVDSRALSHTKSTLIPLDQDGDTPVDSRALSHTKSTLIPLDQDGNTPVDSRALSHTKSTPIQCDQDGNTQVESCALSYTKSTPKPLDQDNDISCGFVDQRYVNFYRAWVAIENILYFWLPVLILVPANTATWIKLYRSSRQSLTSSTAEMIRRTRHVLVLTSLISAGFIIFVGPITAMFTIEALLADDFKYPLYNAETWAVLQLISECLGLCNHSLNFFLYILSGKRFRNSLKAAFCTTRTSP